MDRRVTLGLLWEPLSYTQLLVIEFYPTLESPKDHKFIGFNLAHEKSISLPYCLDLQSSTTIN